MKSISTLMGLGLSLTASLVLVGCAKHAQAHPQTSGSSAVATEACTDNAFLQRYGCSLERVEQAAENNDPDAQYALGYMYYNGIGTVRDPDTAVVWIKRAAQQGQPLAINAMQAIRQAQFPKMGQVHVAAQQHPAAAPVHSAVVPAKHMTHPVLQQSAPAVHALPVYHRRVTQSHATQPQVTQPHVILSHASQPQVAPTHTLQPHVQSHIAQAPQVNMGVSVDNAMVSQMPSANYTVQLFASTKYSSAAAYRQHWQHQVPMYIVSTHLHGMQWYTVIAGNFPTRAVAMRYVQSLPVQQRATSPWVRTFSQIAAAMSATA